MLTNGNRYKKPINKQKFRKMLKKKRKCGRVGISRVKRFSRLLSSSKIFLIVNGSPITNIK